MKAYKMCSKPLKSCCAKGYCSVSAADGLNIDILNAYERNLLITGKYLNVEMSLITTEFS